jgi:hypothetical protein
MEGCTASILRKAKYGGTGTDVLGLIPLSLDQLLPYLEYGDSTFI